MLDEGEVARPKTVARQAVKYGSYPLVTLAAVSCLEAGERQSLAQAVDGIQGQFHVSDFGMGFLATAMAVIGVFGAFPFGHFADRLRRTWMLASAMGIWTFCMFLNVLAPTYALLFASRMGVGVVEANGPATQSLISDYYPVHERAKKMGLAASGALIGSIVGLSLGGVLVDAFSWRAAFWMWIPFGVIVIWMLLRAPEPRRGDQELDLDSGFVVGDSGELEAIASLVLPEPTRIGSLDYANCTWRDALKEVMRIRSMWFAVLAITISQGLLAGLGFWAVEYFKRQFDMSASAAGALAGVFLLTAALGIVGGGILADRLMRRGQVNARIYVVSFASLAATAFLLPAFISTNLTLTTPLFLLAGLFITLPIAPADAILQDVVVAPLRGRASAMRSAVRALGSLAPVTIGALADVFDLRVAFIILTPLYAIGGIVMLAAAKTYPADLAYVAAESRRIQQLRPT